VAGNQSPAYFFTELEKINRDGQSTLVMKATLRRPSGFILFVLLGMLVVTTCAGGVFLYATRMPDPATADLRGLLRWLVTRDLSNEDVAVQEQLLARLEAELRNGFEVTGARDELTDAQRQALVANADVLGRRWFMKQVDRYFAHSDAQRPRYLSEQIDEIERSGIVKTLSAIVAEDDGPPRNIWASLSRRIERWTARLAPEQKAKAEQYVAAVQGNLLWRTLRASLGTSS
jgi:hypothetical protein